MIYFYDNRCVLNANKSSILLILAIILLFYYSIPDMYFLYDASLALILPSQYLWAIDTSQIGTLSGFTQFYAASM